MEYTRLGASGLQVSRITLGCMSWGDGGDARPWVRDEAFADETIRAALEAGVTFFDTANVYSAGTSEEFTGRSLWKHAEREDVVLATKVFNPMRPGPNGRRAVAPLDPARDRRQPVPPRHRLRRPLPDPPLRPGHAGRGDHGGRCTNVVRAGKVRYLGASSMYAWQFAKMQGTPPSGTAGRRSCRCRTHTT